MTIRTTIGLAALAAVLALPATAAAAACPSKRGTVAKQAGGRVWHQGPVLYGCARSDRGPARARRLGPWTPATRVVFDGLTVAWTTRIVRDGAPADRLWAGSAQDGSRWFAGKRAVPAAGDLPEREALVRRLLLRGRSIAWVTGTGDVGMAVEFSAFGPEPIGTLPAPLRPDGKRLLLGTFAQDDPAALAGTLRLRELPGETDECGGSLPYEATVRPAAATEPLGAVWFSTFVSSRETCL